MCRPRLHFTVRRMTAVIAGIAVLLWYDSWSVSIGDGKLLPTLRRWTAIVVILALDFAIISRDPRLPHRLYTSDAAVVLIPLLTGMVKRQTIWDAWSLACIVAILGGLSLPADSGR